MPIARATTASQTPAVPDQRPSSRPPTARTDNAVDDARVHPSWSGSLAPTTRMTRTSTP